MMPGKYDANYYQLAKMRHLLDTHPAVFLERFTYEMFNGWLDGHETAFQDADHVVAWMEQLISMQRERESW